MTANIPTRRRLLRTHDEIFALGYAEGLAAPPLTESQINTLAAIFAPVLSVPLADKPVRSTA